MSAAAMAGSDLTGATRYRVQEVEISSHGRQITLRTPAAGVIDLLFKPPVSGAP